MLERLLWLVLLIVFLLIARRVSTHPFRRSRSSPGECHALLYFWGPGCSACVAAKPVIEELAREIPGLQVRLIDATVERTEAARWGVMTLPTLILLDEAGSVTYRVSGAFSPQRLRKALRAQVEETQLP